MQEPSEVLTGEPEPPPRGFSVERALLALVMGMLCVITMANVVVRYFTNISFAFTEEISVWLMVVMTLIGAATAFRHGKHIAITFVVDLFGPSVRRRFALFGLGASALMFGLIVWYGGRMAWDDFRYDVTSPALGAPQWLYSAWLPALALYILLRLLTMLRRGLNEPS
jgi:TRAP-type transport system small permease protein